MSSQRRGLVNELVVDEFTRATDVLARLTKPGMRPDHEIPLLLPGEVAAADGLGFFVTEAAGAELAAIVGHGFVIRQVEDNVWSAPLFFRVGGLAEGFPGGGGVVETALLLVSDDVGDVWTKDQVSSEPDLALGAGATRRAGGPGKTFEYSLGGSTLLVDLALQGEHRATFSRDDDMLSALYADAKQALPEDVRGGRVDPPEQAKPLYELLGAISRAAAGPRPQQQTT